MLVKKIWLSLFHLSKIIKLAKRVDFSTFASIVSPWKDPEKVVQAVNRVAETLPQLVGRYLPWVFFSSFLEVPLKKRRKFSSLSYSYQGIGRVRFPVCSIQEESLIPRNRSRKVRTLIACLSG